MGGITECRRALALRAFNKAYHTTSGRLAGNRPRTRANAPVTNDAAQLDPACSVPVSGGIAPGIPSPGARRPRLPSTELIGEFLRGWPQRSVAVTGTQPASPHIEWAVRSD